MIAIYVGAKALTSAYESTTDRADHALRVFDAVAEGEFRAVTSELTLDLATATATVTLCCRTTCASPRSSACASSASAREVLAN